MDKTDVLISLLKGRTDSTLVFVRTKRECDHLAGRLKRADINAEPIHGDLSQAERERALRRFEEGKIDVLVATDVAARGLDIDDITLVVNYDPPEDHKAYLHRVGRTARAGTTGTAVTLATWQERSDVEKMARMLKLHPHIVEIFSSDPRLQQVGTAEIEGAPQAADMPDRPRAAGAYAKLSAPPRRRPPSALAPPDCVTLRSRGRTRCLRRRAARRCGTATPSRELLLPRDGRAERDQPLDLGVEVLSALAGPGAAGSSPSCLREP